MLLSFNDFIERVGLDPREAKLVRHDKRGLACWRHSPERFDEYVSVQNAAGNPYLNARVAYQFVPGPKLDGGEHTALFLRAHRILDSWTWTEGSRMPRTSSHDSEFRPTEGQVAFDFETIEAFERYSELILVNWEHAPAKRSQLTERPKEIIELRRTAGEMNFPGFSKFSASIDDVQTFPETWRAALRSVGGVYMLVCPDEGLQYVGSASGEDGFYGRWLQYAADGHGGNKLLKSRPPSNYSISILEVSSPDMAARDVVARESAWKDKLGSRAHGLNAN